MDVELKNLKEVRKYIKDIPHTAFDDCKTILAKAVFDAHAETTENATSKLNRRSGALARSLKTDIRGDDLSSLRASLYSASAVGGKEVVYAPIHEYGGTITAKNAYKKVPGGPYLNIPTDENKTPAGVMRYTARQVFNMGGYIKKFRSGKYGVVLPGNGLMFTLKQQVDIPPRLGMHDAAEKQVPTILSGLRALIGED